MDRRTFMTLVAATALAPELASGATEVAGLPERQFAWGHGLRKDPHGNDQLPAHHFLAILEVEGTPGRAQVARLETVLRRLERRFPWRSDGLLFLLGWGPRYFTDVVGLPPADSPVPEPRALSSFETPNLDTYHACLHVATDDRERLKAVRAALFEGATPAELPADLDLRSVFRLAELRAGFSGAPRPSEHQDVSGIPRGRPVARTSPLFMGFQSGFRGNQASEDDVTIAEGAFRGGTTMHVSRLRLRLQDWYGLLTEEERVARMFSPLTTVAEVKRPANGPPHHADRTVEAARRYGVAGHTQKAAQARRDGKPLIIRRDFNTADGGLAGLHFVALQRSIDDFVAVRRAMNGENLPYEHPGIGPRINNGILEFIFVLHRANFLVPPRSGRAFPLLERRVS